MSGLTRAPVASTRSPHRQRGAASLIVVMVLFFIVSLMAAYTNRSLIFEQRTAGNQYRSTQALEAAEAGVEWALAMLNSGRIADDCAPSTAPTDPSFRQRYLSIDAGTGKISRVVRPDGLGALWPSCVHDGSNWTCTCLRDGAPALAAPAGTGVYPAFRVQFQTLPGLRPGMIRIQSNGCTRLDDNCLNFPSRAVPGEGRATIQALVALRSGLATAPAAALTVRNDLNVGAAPLGLFNSEPRTNGLTALVGGSSAGSSNLRLHGHPGSPPDLSIIDGDADLNALSADRLFANTFGVPPAVYRKQPAAVTLPSVAFPCPGAVCNAATVRAALAANPGRVLWVNGSVVFDSAGDIGAAAEPAVLVATGNVQWVTAVDVYGLVYSQAANWSSAGTGLLRGAAIAEGRFTGNAGIDIVYDTDVLDRVRRLTGSYVRVPGSWKDF